MIERSRGSRKREKLFKADVTLFEEFLDRFKEKFAQRVKQGREDRL